jgi:hypothetical protein
MSETPSAFLHPPRRLAVPPAEAAQLLGLSLPRLWEEVAHGRLVARRATRRPLFSIAELERWVATLPEIDDEEIAERFWGSRTEATAERHARKSTGQTQDARERTP